MSNSQTNIVTIYCRVCAVQMSQYTAIVVEDLNRNETDDLKYVTVIKLPNWETPTPEIWDEGYLQFEFVEAGTTRWINRETHQKEVYKYNNNYFMNFYKKRDENNVEEYNF